MKLNTKTPALLKTGGAISEMLLQLRLRLICVLQRGGVESAADVNDYIQWAAGYGVREICFKELYVATAQRARRLEFGELQGRLIRALIGLRDLHVLVLEI
jgi:hypothetical protein